MNCFAERKEKVTRRYIQKTEYRHLLISFCPDASFVSGLALGGEACEGTRCRCQALWDEVASAAGLSLCCVAVWKHLARNGKSRSGICFSEQFQTRIFPFSWEHRSSRQWASGRSALCSLPACTRCVHWIRRRSVVQNITIIIVHCCHGENCLSGSLVSLVPQTGMCAFGECCLYPTGIFCLVQDTASLKLSPYTM